MAPRIRPLPAPLHFPAAVAIAAVACIIALSATDDLRAQPADDREIPLEPTSRLDASARVCLRLDLRVVNASPESSRECAEREPVAHEKTRPRPNAPHPPTTESSLPLPTPTSTPSPSNPRGDDEPASPPAESEHAEADPPAAPSGPGAQPDNPPSTADAPAPQRDEPLPPSPAAPRPSPPPQELPPIVPPRAPEPATSAEPVGPPARPDADAPGPWRGRATSAILAIASRAVDGSAPTTAPSSSVPRETTPPRPNAPAAPPGTTAGAATGASGGTGGTSSGSGGGGGGPGAGATGAAGDSGAPSASDAAPPSQTDAAPRGPGTAARGDEPAGKTPDHPPAGAPSADAGRARPRAPAEEPDDAHEDTPRESGGGCEDACEPIVDLPADPFSHVATVPPARADADPTREAPRAGPRGLLERMVGNVQTYLRLG